jgi:hypothetical protein
VIDVQPDGTPFLVHIEPDVRPDLAGIGARALLKLDVKRIGLGIIEQPHDL